MLELRGRQGTGRQIGQDDGLQSILGVTRGRAHRLTKHIDSVLSARPIIANVQRVESASNNQNKTAFSTTK